MPRPELIFVTRRPPFPLDNGARIRAQRLAAGLSRRLPVTLVTFADGPTHDETRSSREDLERVLPDARIVLVAFGRPHPAGVKRRILRGGSTDFGAVATPSLRLAVRQLVSESQRPVLHLDDAVAGLAGLDAPAALTVFAPHNVEHHIVRTIARDRPLRQRVFLEAEWRKIAAEERRLWRGSDVCLAVSEIDAEAMRAGGARRVEVVPNGTDPVEAPPLRTPRPGEPLRLLFVGSGAFWPYELGLRWFVTEVMPRLRERGPVAFEVVGERPRDPVRAPDVAYTGRVPDVGPYYARAHALVVPVFQGSGTRLKVIEGAAMGRPVISTRLGAEGLPLTAGEHYIAAEDAPGFEAAVERVRNMGRDEMDRLTRAARDAIDPLMWPRITERLADLYEDGLSVR